MEPTEKDKLILWGTTQSRSTGKSQHMHFYKTVIKMNDVAKVEELSEPEFTDHAVSAGIFFLIFRLIII